MRFLIVEDDLGSRRLLEAIGRRFGECNSAVNGEEAVEAYRLSWEEKAPYVLIFLDIMMPELNGLDALAEIRRYEEEIGVRPGKGVKVIMTTALEDPQTVIKAYYHGEVDSYLVKPIEPEQVERELRQMKLI